MKIDVLKKKFNFTQENLEKIKDSVAKAEKDNSGELAVVITPSSSFYTLWEMIAAFVCSLICFTIMIPFSDNILQFLQRIFWVTNVHSVPLFMLCVMLCVFVLAYLIFNIPFFDRLIVNRKIMNQYVQNKALRTFVLSDVYSTSKHTGVLIFVSILERNVQIICDKGILSSTNQDEWDEIASDLAKGFSKNNPTDNIISAIERCGKLFSSSFSLKKDEVIMNELADGVVFIEGGEL